MNARQFWFILVARRTLILGVLAASVLLTLAVNLVQPSSYKATASVLLNYKGVDPVTGATTPGQLLPGYMATQIDIIGSKHVALRVVDSLKLASSAAVKDQFLSAAEGKGDIRDWLADLLRKKLDILPSRESSVVDISFSGADPQFAAVVSNAFAEEYQRASVGLKVEPMKKTSAYFNEQTRQLRDNVETAQSRLSKYQQEKGIVSLDNNRIDIELSRLNDLSAQLVAAQAAVMEASSRQQVASGSTGASPDVANNALIQSLRISLAAAEARFAETAQRLARNHPQYQSAQAELTRLRDELRAAMTTVARSVGSNADVLRQREQALKVALAQQHTRVLELNRTRDELGVLIKDLDSAQRAFDAASARAFQTRIEAQSEQSDIAILNPAVAPLEPAAPRVLLNSLAACIIGTVLGVTAALAREFQHRPVRSSDDLLALDTVPLLGTISWQAAPPPRTLKALLPKRLRLT
ncbi:chain length determinant protein EpsF [Massilia sp. S19_KUP03_FR1]|uniref:chain length determinant protein EpsF n=1 Tax=Massilia sp. S19_KUP03_FR1 TaxID=3025503 RepID=UPI002FCCFCDE